MITLVIQVPLGIILYWTLSKVFHVDSYTYIIDTVKGYFGKKKAKEN